MRVSADQLGAEAEEVSTGLDCDGFESITVTPERPQEASSDEDERMVKRKGHSHSGIGYEVLGLWKLFC